MIISMALLQLKNLFPGYAEKDEDATGGHGQDLPVKVIEASPFQFIPFGNREGRLFPVCPAGIVFLAIYRL